MIESSIQPENFGTRKVQKEENNKGELDKVSKGDPKLNKTLPLFFFF